MQREKQSQPPTAKVRMLIRRPVADVFNAIAGPDVLSKFWLSSPSAPLEVGTRTRWEFRVPGVSVECSVRALVPNEHILIDWSDGTKLEWKFERRPDDTTVLEVENSGFKGEPAEVLDRALESTQGFAIVVCDLKALLELGASPGLVQDAALLIAEELQRTRG